MNDSTKRLRILGRAQASLLRIQLKKSIQKLIFVSVGLVFSLLSLGVLNHAAYSAIEQRIGPAPAGLIVGFSDLVLAFVMFALGVKDAEPSEEERLAYEISAMASEGLSSDFDDASKEVQDFMKSTRRLGEIAHSVTSFVGGPIVQSALTLLSQESATRRRDAPHDS